MSTQKEVNKFLSEIPFSKPTQRMYTIEEARGFWKENYRDRIYTELQIQHVQNKIKNKITKNVCSDEKDILFGKTDIVQEVDNLGAVNLISDEEYIESEGSESCGAVEENNNPIKVLETVKENKARGSKYLDIEAEQSDDSFEEEDDDDGTDISSMIDEEQYDENTAAEIYAGEKKKHDVEVLRQLVKKFQKKKHSDLHTVEKRELEDFSSEEEFFSEAPIEELEIQKDFKEFEIATEEKYVEQKDSVIKFKNLENVVEQLEKKRRFTFK